MYKSTIIAAFSAALVFPAVAEAQTNLQVFYDFGKDRGHVTTTLEGFYNDDWGNTFFFVDYDYEKNTGSKEVPAYCYSPSGTYFEIARCLNFWQDTKLSPLSIHVEYNGGVYSNYSINHAFLAGLDWFIHSDDFRNTLNVKVLGKYINYKGANRYDMKGDKRRSAVPMQFTLVWGMKDLFGAEGLTFSGFADFWWESHSVAPYSKSLERDWSKAKDSDVVFLAEPQLWYNVGRHFGVDNLNVGTEIELSYDFGTGKGFWCRPCLGAKWVF